MSDLISRKTITKSAFLIISFISMLTFISLFYFWQLNKQTERILEQHNYKIELLFEMSQIARDRSFDMFSMYLSDDVWQRDETFLRFNKRALAFIILKQEILQTELSDEMKAGLDKAFSVIRKTQPIQESIVSQLQEGKKGQIKQEIINKDLPLEYELYIIFDNLIVLARTEAEDAKKLLDDRYHTAVYITLISFILIVMITIVVMIRSMNKLHANEMSISWDAVHDHLTRVYNRRWLSDYLSSHVIALDKDEEHAVLYLDLDNFKPINDRFGHSAGDKVLIDVVEIFRNCIRKNDTIVRIGGDEFVILLEHCSVEKTQNIAQEILTRLANYRLEQDAEAISGLSCSIGIAFIDQQTSWQLALEYADEECNKVKQAGKSDISVH